MKQPGDPLEVAFEEGREAACASERERAKANDRTGATFKGRGMPGSLALHFGIKATQPTAAGTVIRGLLHTGSVTLVYGAPKSGKSFLMTSSALAVAAGEKDWMGHAILRSGPILYVACEGHSGFWKRLRAAKLHAGWSDSDFPLGFGLATGRPVLIRSDDISRAYAPDAGSIMKAMQDMRHEGLPPVAVVIDTVFRSIGGGNINNSDVANAYLAAVSMIADDGVAVAIIHHETKAGATPAGSVALMAGADTIVRVWRGDGDERLWQVEAAKDDAETEPRGFRLEPVLVGDDAEGQPVSSCVVVDAGQPDGDVPGRAKKGGGGRGKVPAHIPCFRALCDLLATPGKAVNRIMVEGYDAVPAISRETLRETLRAQGFFLTEGNGPLSAADRGRLRDALEWLRVKGKIVVRGEYISLPPPRLGA